MAARSAQAGPQVAASPRFPAAAILGERLSPSTSGRWLPPGRTRLRVEREDTQSMTLTLEEVPTAALDDEY